MPENVSIGTRFEALFQRARTEGKTAMLLWLDDAENERGGSLMVRARHTRGSGKDLTRLRDVVEVGYETESMRQMRIA